MDLEQEVVEEMIRALSGSDEARREALAACGQAAPEGGAPKSKEELVAFAIRWATAVRDELAAAKAASEAAQKSDEESRGQLAAAAAAREAAQRDADELRGQLAAVLAASPGAQETAQQAATEAGAQRAAAEAAQQEAEATRRQLTAVGEERASALAAAEASRLDATAARAQLDAATAAHEAQLGAAAAAHEAQLRAATAAQVAAAAAHDAQLGVAAQEAAAAAAGGGGIGADMEAMRAAVAEVARSVTTIAGAAAAGGARAKEAPQALVLESVKEGLQALQRPTLGQATSDAASQKEVRDTLKWIAAAMRIVSGHKAGPQFGDHGSGMIIESLLRKAGLARATMAAVLAAVQSAATTDELACKLVLAVDADGGAAFGRGENRMIATADLLRRNKDVSSAAAALSAVKDWTDSATASGILWAGDDQRQQHTKQALRRLAQSFENRDVRVGLLACFEGVDMPEAFRGDFDAPWQPILSAAAAALSNMVLTGQIKQLWYGAPGASCDAPPADAPTACAAAAVAAEPRAPPTAPAHDWAVMYAGEDGRGLGAYAAVPSEAAMRLGVLGLARAYNVSFARRARLDGAGCDVWLFGQDEARLTAAAGDLIDLVSTTSGCEEAEAVSVSVLQIMKSHHLMPPEECVLEARRRDQQKRERNGRFLPPRADSGAQQPSEAGGSVRSELAKPAEFPPLAHVGAASPRQVAALEAVARQAARDRARSERQSEVEDARREREWRGQKERDAQLLRQGIEASLATQRVCKAAVAAAASAAAAAVKAALADSAEELRQRAAADTAAEAKLRACVETQRRADAAAVHRLNAVENQRRAAVAKQQRTAETKQKRRSRVQVPHAGSESPRALVAKLLHEPRSVARRGRAAAAEAAAAAKARMATPELRKAMRGQKSANKRQRQRARRAASHATKAAAIGAAATQHLGGRQDSIAAKAAKAKDCVVVTLKSGGASVVAVAVGDTGAQIGLMAERDVAPSMQREIRTFPIPVPIGGIGSGRLAVGYLQMRVLLHDARGKPEKAGAPATIYLVSGEQPVDARATLLIGVDFFDDNEITRVGGKEPVLVHVGQPFPLSTATAAAAAAEDARGLPKEEAGARAKYCVSAADRKPQMTAAQGPARKSGSARDPVVDWGADYSALRELFNGEPAGGTVGHAAAAALSSEAARQRQPAARWGGDARAEAELRDGEGGGQLVQQRTEADDVQYAIGRTEADFVVPPRSFKEHIPISLHGADTKAWASTAVHLEPAMQEGFDGLLVASTICAANGCATDFINITDEAIAVPRGTHVASACRIRCADQAPVQGTQAAACAATSAIRVGAKQPTDSGNGAKTQDLPWAERLASMHYGKEMGPEKEAQLKDRLSRWPDVLSFKLKKNNLAKAAIDTTGFSPSFARSHRLTQHEQGLMAAEVQRLLDLGVVEPAGASPWGSPLLCVTKPDGSNRIVSDFRELNKRTVNVPSWPLPDVTATLENLRGCEWHSAADSLHGYWGQELEEGSRDKTAFLVGQRQYRWTRLPMGTIGATGTFQQAMAGVCACLPHTQVFLDDTCTSSRTWEAHLDDIEAMLGAFRAHGITIKPSKCFWGFKKLKWLGYQNSGTGIRLDDGYLDALKQRRSTPPTNLRECQRLVGLLLWCSKFMRGFARICEPIFRINKKGIKWTTSTWGPEQAQAYDASLEALGQFTTMHHPVGDGPMRLTTDWSKEASGGVLTQEQNGRHVPIAFVSALNSERESTYSASEGEALAAVRCLKKLRYYLHGRQFELVSDHKAVTDILDGGGSKSTRLQNWYTTMQDFNYIAVQKPGTSIAYCDYFSRGPFSEGTWRPAPKQDALARPALELYGDPAAAIGAACAGTGAAHVAASTSVPRDASAFADFSAEQLRTAQSTDRLWRSASAIADANAGEYIDRDNEVEAIIARAAKPDRATLTKLAPELAHNDDNVLVVKSGDGARLCVPEALRPATCAHFHDDSGHGSAAASAARAKRWCFWPNMQADFRHYVDTCSACRSRRGPSRGTHGNMGKLSTPERNFDEWHLDCSGEIVRKGAGGQAFVVMAAVCGRSKIVEAIKVPLVRTKSAKKALLAANVRDAFLSGVMRRYGRCTRIVSDPGSEFRGEFEEWATREGIPIHNSTKPRHNSCLAERFFAVFWDRLSLMVPQGETDWDEIVGMTVAAYNTAPSRIGGLSPHEMVYGQAAATTLEVAWQPSGLAAKASLEAFAAMEKRQIDARKNAQIVAHARAAARPTRQRSTITFAAGEQVWVRSDLTKTGTTAKIFCNYVPAVVRKIAGHNKYECKSCYTGRIIVRDIGDMRDRSSRKKLLEKWKCKPFLHEQMEPGDQAVEPTAEILGQWQPKAGKAKRSKQAGRSRVIMTCAPAAAGQHPFTGEPIPRALVVKLLHEPNGQGKVKVQWMSDADGNRPPDSFVSFRPSLDRGTCTSAEGSDVKGAWARYEGPSLDEGRRLDYLVSRTWSRSTEGRAQTVFRCRMRGVKGHLDQWGTEDQVREWWPEQAREHLRLFEERCVDIGSGTDAVPPQAPG